MDHKDRIVIFPKVSIGSGARIDPFVILGRPPEGVSPGDLPLSLGNDALIRSHTVIYAGTQIGDAFQTGHHVLIREHCKVGDKCSVGSGCVVEFSVTIGRGVRLHSQAFVPEYCVIEDGCWIGPGAALTNCKYPESKDAKKNLRGVTLKRGVILGARAIVLPGIVVGEKALIGAGSVVVSDVAPGMVMAGNPARIIGEVAKLRDEQSGLLLYGEPTQ